MRLDLLLQRENFPELFIASLQRLLQREEGWKGGLKWGAARWSLPSNALLVNPKLNVIYSPLLEGEQLRKLTAEYRYHPNPIRRLLQSLYVRFGPTFPFDRLTAITAIEVEPWSERLEHCCILPGNHTIRIVELDRGRCRVLLKQGFRLQFIQNEINVRSRYPFLPVPALLEWDQKREWYLEERVIALPWNRIASADLRSTMLLQAQAALSKLYSHSQERVLLPEWIEHVHNALLQAVVQLPSVYDEEARSVIKKVHERLSAVVLTDGDEWIDTVQSHGDFQPANILVAEEGEDGSLYLIDWEYSVRRYRLYDALVFAAQARFPVGLEKRLDDLLENHSNSQSWCWCWCWCCQKEVELKLERWMVALFLLEDLLVRLEELQIPDLKQRGDGLTQWLVEVESWLS